MYLLFMCRILILVILSLFISCNIIPGETSLDPDIFSLYDKDDCPDGFVKVSGNTTFGVEDFCVMQYEAKNVSGVATSVPDFTPWTNITYEDAKTQCQNLGSCYDIISNPEWMTIARDAESNDNNWRTFSSSIHCILGNNNQSILGGISSLCNVGLASIGYGSSRSSRAALELSDGSLIWDFVANVAEFVDWTLSIAVGYAPACLSSAGVTELYEITSISSACSSLSVNDYSPAYSFSGLTNVSASSNQFTTNLGNFTAFTTIINPILTRGGDVNNGGPFDFYLLPSSIQAATNRGFRCVYRINQCNN